MATPEVQPLPRPHLCLDSPIDTTLQPGTTAPLPPSSSSDTSDRTHLNPDPNTIATSMDLSVTRLTTSPYPTPRHKTDLAALSRPTALLTHALTLLAPTTPTYATAPYLSSLNFPFVLSVLRALLAREHLRWEGRAAYHVVIFRSVLKRGADGERLGELDARAHQEAVRSGGLLRYWFGEADRERRNLATCIWRAPEDATRGGAGPHHAACRRVAGEMYECISFSAHRFIVEDGAVSCALEDY